MKIANILLRHPYDEAETRWRGQHADLILGKVAPYYYRTPILEENPNAILCDYILPPQYEQAKSDLVRISTLATASLRSFNPCIDGLLYDVPLNHGPSNTTDTKHAQLSMLAEVQGMCRGRTMWVNLVDSQLVVEGPPTWEPWCMRLKNVALAYLFEDVRIDRMTPELIDALNDIEKPMIFMFHRGEPMPVEEAKQKSFEYAQALDATNRYFGYRDAPKWVDPRRIETWQLNELMQAAR